MRRARQLRRRLLRAGAASLHGIEGRLFSIDAVFLGDLLTREWFDADPGFFLGRRRQAAGVNGATTADMLARFARDAAKRRPRVVHIMGGTNDLWHGDPGVRARGTIANLEAMVALARAAGIVPLIAAPPPVATIAAALFTHADLFPAMQAGIQDLCRREAIAHVDYAPALIDGDGRLDPTCTTDGVHLNRRGYRAMRGLAAAALAAAA